MSEPVNVNNMNTEEFKKFLDSFDHVFSDCDGKIVCFFLALMFVILMSYSKKIRNDITKEHFSSNIVFVQTIYEFFA